jgi:predicted chitinase
MPDEYIFFKNTNMRVVIVVLLIAALVFAQDDSSIDIEDLRAIMPNLSASNAAKYLPALNRALAEGQINTCERQSAFLAQLAHESGQLHYWEELASGSAYEGRKDLGNTHPGDGKRYKGRGPIQITGRANYRACGAALKIDLENNPTLMATTDVGFRSAVWFWGTRNLNDYADENDQENFDRITKRINGGYNGKADRDQFWRRAKKALDC